MTPERQTILEGVQRVREGADTHRHLKFARHSLRIPEKDFYAILRLYPAMAAIDPMEKSAAWEHFETTAFAEPYQVGKVRAGYISNGNLGVARIIVP